MVNQIDFAGDTEQTETPSVTSQGHEQEFAGLGSAAVTPLIGRNAELRLLEDRWEQAQEGQSQIVLVLGEAGLGKSRLVRTIVRQIRETSVSADQPGSQVVEWRCAEHFQNSELHPVSDFMNRFLGFAADDSPSVRFERLARHLEDYGLNSPEGVSLFAKLLFLPEDDRYLAGGLTPAREREETFRAVRQWLDACSAKRPTLFIIEDLHWSDASTLEFLSQLIEGGQSGQILTILTFRPEFKVPWPAAAHQTFLALNRLSRRQVTEWMRTGSNIALPDSLITQVYQRTCGVPLLVEEFTRMVRESTVAAPTSSAAPTNPVPPREIPATLQDLVIARLDRMGCDREIVLLTSTLGQRFDYDLLAATASVAWLSRAASGTMASTASTNNRVWECGAAVSATRKRRLTPNRLIAPVCDSNLLILLR